VILPPLTVGLPVYNNKRHVAQSIQSLLDQSYGDFVMLICDNASTDGTADICREFAAKDRRIEYHRNAVNIGLYPNFNRVFELTKTRYLKWSTGDDYWSPQFLAEAMPVIRADASVAAVYPKTTFVDANGNVTGLYEDRLHLVEADPVARLIRFMENVQRCHPHLGVLDCEAIRRTRLFGNYQGGDYVFLADLALYGKFVELPQRYFFRRFHEDSSSWERHDDKHQSRRLYAANSKGGNFDYVRQRAAYFRRVLRSAMSISQKLRAMNYLTRRTWWDREVLVRDLKGSFRRTRAR
jgi:glycosyltransferase involved in cell wall biosynthesis